MTPDLPPPVFDTIVMAHAVDLATTPSIQLIESNRLWWHGASHAAAQMPLSDLGLPTQVEFAVRAALIQQCNALADFRISNTNRLRDQISQMLNTIAQGDWSDIGLPADLMGEPPPELRQRIMETLGVYATQRAQVNAAILATRFEVCE